MKTKGVVKTKDLLPRAASHWPDTRTKRLSWHGQRAVPQGIGFTLYEDFPFSPADAASIFNVRHHGTPASPPEDSAVVQLHTRLDGLERSLTERLQELEAKVSTLEEQAENAAPFPLDQIDLWLEANIDRLEAFRGKHVAVHPTRGIIASGDDLESVWEAAERAGLLQEVLLTTIPLNAG